MEEVASRMGEVAGGRRDRPQTGTGIPAGPGGDAETVAGPGTGSGTGPGGGTGRRALEILRDQHRRLSSLLDDLRRGDLRGDRQAPDPGLVTRLLDELDAHRRLEQEVFYPALRLHGGHDLAGTLQSRVAEHRRLDELAQRLGNALERMQGLEGESPPSSDGNPGAARLAMAAGGLATPAPAGAGGRYAAGGGPGDEGTPAPAVPAEVHGPWAGTQPGGDAGAAGDATMAGVAAGGAAAADGTTGDARAGAPGLQRLVAELAAAFERHRQAEEGELHPLAGQRLHSHLGGVAAELVRGMEEFRFDYDDVVEGTFPASDPPATMAAPRVRTPRLYARSRH